MYAWPEVRRGAERYMHELAGALAAAGHDVRILTTARRPGRADIRGVEVRYLRRRHVLRRRLGPLADEAAFGVQALAHLGARAIDVWHAMGTADAAAAALASSARPGLRSIYTDHGFPNPASRGLRPDRRLHDFVVGHVDQYVCVSNAAGDFLRKGYGREPVVLSGGVDMARHRPATHRHPAPALLFVGDASESRKNLPLLLEAVAVLRGRCPDVELWVAGPGDQAAAVAAAPEAARGATTLLGEVDPDALADLYGRAWVTVLPAHAEAFGLVLVESLASGTPIVGLDRGGPAEIVKPGVGFTCEPSPQPLADACEQALDLATRPGLVDECRSVARLWDWRTSIVPRILDLYDRRP